MAGTAKTVGTVEKIGLREAVEIARRHLNVVFGGTLEGLQLEETEISEDGRRWAITLGFLRDEPAISGVFAAMTLPKKERVYKIVSIDAYTGDVKSMKIRKP